MSGRGIEESEEKSFTAAYQGIRQSFWGTTMKIKIARIFISIFEYFLRFIYCFLKLFEVKENKILFCSRQMNDIPLDFLLIQEKVKQEFDSVKCVMICRHIGHGAVDYIVFFKELLRSMYHLSTSRVCIIDSYWPAVSLLKHKKQLKVIQIWHAIGKIKKSGYQSIGKTSGRKPEYAGLLRMHANYDYVIAGAKAWNRYYCESFNISEDKLLNYGLPRIDYLVNENENIRKRFFEENPEFIGKQIILYAPTFRRNMKAHWEDIIDAVDYDKYILIIRNHPGQRTGDRKLRSGAFYMEGRKTMDLIPVCDYLITDYSAIALEAAVLKKKTYYWTYDYDEYAEKNGLNFEVRKELPEYVFEDIDELMADIEKGSYDMEPLCKYIDKYLPEELGTSTEKLLSLISSLLETKGKREARYEICDNGGW